MWGVFGNEIQQGIVQEKCLKSKINLDYASKYSSLSYWPITAFATKQLVIAYPKDLGKQKIITGLEPFKIQ